MRINWHRIFHEFTAHWHYDVPPKSILITECAEGQKWLDKHRRRCCKCEVEVHYQMIIDQS